MMFTSETLSHYSVGALIGMADLMTEILAKMALQCDTRAKFVEALGDLKVLIDAQLDYCPTVSFLRSIMPVTKVKVINPKFVFEKQPDFIIEIFQDTEQQFRGFFSPVVGVLALSYRGYGDERI